MKFNKVDKMRSPENISNILNAQSARLHVLLIDNKVLNCFIYPLIYALLYINQTFYYALILLTWYRHINYDVYPTGQKVFRGCALKKWEKPILITI